MNESNQNTNSINTDAINITPIGMVYSCFPEKFGIPRQSGIAAAARGRIELLDEYGNPDCVRGLEQSSHIWVTFLFSEHLQRGWSPLVRPPRSGGKKMGVFATRSTFRPNPIGLSVVKLESIETTSNKVTLHISGTDMLNGTPVIDIKPYLPYADAIPEATNSYAPSEEETNLTVSFGETAQQQLHQHKDTEYLQTLIEQVLRCDPRPTAHRHKAQDHCYGIRLEDINLRWRVDGETVHIESIEQISLEDDLGEST